MDGFLFFLLLIEACLYSGKVNTARYGVLKGKLTSNRNDTAGTERS